ncbi:hypothetical protein AVEN_152920-1 [Araneus ventricosus]|uniref:Uncharacterized protein n=1 Tax=Araneus ventricosus TaxID=182803 RepID=A0A4Y2ADC8_ARAVE|nr:hypothetical protein AVEN_152920-1 [Araneus ventricosus]
MPIYKIEFTKCKNHCAEAKLNFFREFLDNVLIANTFDTFYDLFVNKDSVQDIIKVIGDTGVETESYKKSERYILKYHFPFLEEDHDGDLDLEPDDCRIEPVVEEEIRSILLQGKKEKVPSLVGLTLGIINEIFNTDFKKF